MQIVETLLFPSNLDVFYLFFVWSMWLGLSILCWIKLARAGIFVLEDLRGKAFSSLPLSVILSVGLLYMAFIMFKYVPSMSTLLRVFVINGWYIFVKFFFFGQILALYWASIWLSVHLKQTNKKRMVFLRVCDIVGHESDSMSLPAYKFISL